MGWSEQHTLLDTPKDNLIVLTLEQVMPYSFNTEWALKGLIYEASLTDGLKNLHLTR